MTTQSFKDLIVWQKSRELVVDIYKAFSGCKDFGFKDQIQRASVSIANNVAEGQARRSDKSFRNFLLIAKGSNAEVESMLLLAVELHYLEEVHRNQLLEKTEEISRMLNGLIKKLSALGS
jgi:four helix bundle protein